MKQMIILPIMAMTMIGTGCGAKSPQVGNDSLATDSIVYNAQGDSTLSCKIYVDYPTDNDSLSVAVCSFLAEELKRQYLPMLNDIENKGKYNAFSGDITKRQQVVDYYGKGTMAYMKSQQEEMKQMLEEYESEEKPNVPQMSEELRIAKHYENSRYLTYIVTEYTYLGGAHGSSLSYGVNINKTTRKPITATVDSLKLTALQPILRKGVLKYLNNEDKTINDKNLNEYLFLADNKTIPLPAFTPYLAPDGIHFLYQQYEIGPYAMGIVNFTVAYNEIKPYLTAEALRMIE